MSYALARLPATTSRGGSASKERKSATRGVSRPGLRQLTHDIPTTRKYIDLRYPPSRWSARLNTLLRTFSTLPFKLNSFNTTYRFPSNRRVMTWDLFGTPKSTAVTIAPDWIVVVVVYDDLSTRRDLDQRPTGQIEVVLHGPELRDRGLVPDVAVVLDVYRALRAADGRGATQGTPKAAIISSLESEAPWSKT